MVDVNIDMPVGTLMTRMLTVLRPVLVLVQVLVVCEMMIYHITLYRLVHSNKDHAIAMQDRSHAIIMVGVVLEASTTNDSIRV